MRSIWKGAIGFGLVNIPVKLYSGVQASELDLDMLDSKDHSHIKFQRINEQTGKEVAWENIVKGYLLDDNYVILDDEDFEKASPENTKTINITDFVDEAEVDPIYFETAYFIEPEKSGARAYQLLYEALKKTGKAGICTFILRSKESLGMIRIWNDMLILQKMRFAEEIRDPAEVELPKKSALKPGELKMAIALIEDFSGEFDISAYKDTYTADLLKLIKAKAKGKVPAKPKMKVVHGKQKDLMEQLKASLGTRTRRKKAS
jgi:DNA end-binding protein Ku